MRFLWITCDFANRLTTADDQTTPQLFLELMHLGAVGRLQRFTQTPEGSQETVWAPGIFSMQVHRPSMAGVVEVLLRNLKEQLPDSGDISLFVQIGRRHYQLPVALDTDSAASVVKKIDEILEAHPPAPASAE